ncbi:hypothetical protein MKQ70_20100 [Chitinophaga sedimenti]|nr:hypothetical protein [Chitinophaga sedimenti]MCK7557181.1 hypothetical protein [Chitinophaga sedimenti]
MPHRMYFMPLTGMHDKRISVVHVSHRYNKNFPIGNVANAAILISFQDKIDFGYR